MKTPTVSVTTEHGTFLRDTWNDYTVITVGTWGNGQVGTTWHRTLKNARTAPRFATVLGFYSVANGEKIAPGFAVQSASERRAAQAAPKPVKVYEFEKCSECEGRHDPIRQRCGNCWRCHEPAVKCKTTKREIADSIERHNQYPDMYRVLTNVWRPFSEVTVAQCSCH
jgi:hypothetical protein